RHWLVRLYQSTGDNNYEVRWQKRLYGFYPPGDFDAGLAAGDVDGDGRAELLISLFPDMYVVQFQPQTNAFEPVWHFRTVRSNTVIVDTLYPGRRQMIANTSSGPAAFELSSSPGRLPAPVRVSARPLDAGTIVISWQSSGAGNQFRLFRGTSADSLSLLAIVTDEMFTDSTVTAGVTYFYAVTARDTSGVFTESRLSRVVSALPGKGPALLRAQYIPLDHVQLLFSEPLSQEARRQGNYSIDGVHPLSVVLAGGGREVLLTFEALSEGSHTVRVRSITDLDQTPIDPSASSAEFFVPGKLPRFYLTGVEIESPRLLAVRFNQSVDPLTAARAGNYSLSTPLVVGSVSLDSVDPRRVLLYLSQGKMAALGREYLVQVSGVTSRSGVALRPGEGDVIGFTVTRDDLNAVFAYPNPFLAGNDRLVTIAGLPRVAFIQIFDEHGRPVRELREADGNGGVSWDGLDAAGNPVPSGIYLVRVRANSGEQYTKIAVVR
ncbi:MAG TPA: T9SS type A sorting domain-containing protein, partial [Bacteroidetes bacterium]|nr:T9SS type A sorting domain-containing protein [Bacteroidota bacterium]